MPTKKQPPAGPAAHDTTVDLLVIGSGTGMATALSAHEQGLKVLVVEKTPYVGGSTARSGGAFWIPANPALLRDGSTDTPQLGREYIGAVVGDESPEPRWRAFVDQGPQTVDMLERTTPMEFFWAKGYSDYHPENPGGAAIGRTCECKPFDAAQLGEERARLRPAVLEAPIPMPVTGADYKWMNLMVRTPLESWPRIAWRAVEGIGGLLLKKEFTAGGQALAAGLFTGLVRAGIPVWTRTGLVELLEEDGAVVGAVLEQDGRRVSVRAARGVVLAAGGFEHDMAMRREFQSSTLAEDVSLGAEGNTGDAIKAARRLGAGLAVMEESWWFPALQPLAKGEYPQVLLAERSLPGSLLVDETGRRFINESRDYMSFGQEVLRLRTQGRPLSQMWLVMDQSYRNRYVFAGVVFPAMSFPKPWYDAGIVVRGSQPRSLAQAMGVPPEDFAQTLERFNLEAGAGIDSEYHRGDSAYDRYYGDPTCLPNPNLRPLKGGLYAARVVLSDLGTCGGLRADEHGRVLREDGSAIPGLYAQGNTAGNVFGRTYPGAGATIAQGLVYGHIIAKHAATA
ncbi:Succinate dehydrogenase/fumarate reductase, flavoprotein subunit [Propionibacterium cyclohexanicum]|uniref:Succinate dehydrogenase/fumarate reductase, flavoprotein subunit n=1 Tax=Propionibacterium cyclohexanicum TaxID=64702 RepID=A0A1H9SQT3_9ACTN|nr:3-ketosteroid-delta-1-dehydrogenase [Propionibacterium cyclohexanicum]SER87237.1 Succinate dehydrogenase/fumarate reductase, flavoprotein subunit [Propionibacterium cyclohexanicum]